jgi:hypothetical protein
VTLIEAVDQAEPLRRQPDARAVALEERPPEATTEQEAHEVAGGRRKPDEPDQRQQLDIPAGRHDAPDHDRRLAGDEQADERTRLEKGEPTDGRVGPDAEGARGILEGPREVRERQDSGEDRQGGRRCECRGPDDDRGAMRNRERGGDGGHCSRVIELSKVSYIK